MNALCFGDCSNLASQSNHWLVHMCLLLMNVFERPKDCAVTVGGCRPDGHPSQPSAVSAVSQN